MYAPSTTSTCAKAQGPCADTRTAVSKMPGTMQKLTYIIFSLIYACSVQAAIELSVDELTLAREIGFDPEILKMVKKTGHRIDVLTGVNRTGNRHVSTGLSFSSAEQQTHGLVERLRARMESMGYRIYIQELGHGYVSDRIAIIKSRDKFDILRTRKTHAYSAGYSTEQIVDRLKGWDRRYGLKLIGAGYNWIKAEFVHSPDDISRFSRELLEFCPNVLSSMSGTRAQLERDLKAERIIFLQWK